MRHSSIHPQTKAMTFPFSSVFILLLWCYIMLLHTELIIKFGQQSRKFSITIRNTVMCFYFVSDRTAGNNNCRVSVTFFVIKKNSAYYPIKFYICTPKKNYIFPVFACRIAKQKLSRAQLWIELFLVQLQQHSNFNLSHPP